MLLLGSKKGKNSVSLSVSPISRFKNIKWKNYIRLKTSSIFIFPQDNSRTNKGKATKVAALGPKELKALKVLLLYAELVNTRTIK